jgi:hypothetical protein
LSETNRTDIKKAKFLRLLEVNEGNVSHTCKAAHMGRQTYYGWLKEDAEFAELVENIQESLVDWGEGLLRQRMSKGDTTAIIFFLKTKGKKRGYVERQEMDHSGAIKTNDKLVIEVVHTRPEKAEGGNGNGGNGNGGEKK